MPPLYDYVCPECKATLEKLEPFISDPPVCVHCQKAEMVREPVHIGRWKFGTLEEK